MNRAVQILCRFRIHRRGPQVKTVFPLPFCLIHCYICGVIQLIISRAVDGRVGNADADGKSSGFFRSEPFKNMRSFLNRNRHPDRGFVP